MGMQPGYTPPSGSMNPPLTEEAWNNRHKSSRHEPPVTPEDKNQGTRHIHPCCENNFKLVTTSLTMYKIWLSFWKAGISFEDAQMVVEYMLHEGILFREEAKP